MRGRRPLVGRVLTAQHLAARWAFARERQNWQVHHWRPIPLTDESRFTLKTCDRCERVWRRCGERNAVGQWWSGDADPWRVRDNGSLNAVRFRDEILRAIIGPYAGAVGPGFLLVQDNARPHGARVCRQFLDDEGIDAIDWPSHSPDLNPIENLWDVMYRFIWRNQDLPQTLQELTLMP